MKKRKLITLIYILLTIIVMVFIGVMDKNIKDLGRAFLKLDPLWVGGAFLCMILYWIADAFVLCYLTASMYQAKHRLHSLKVSLIGQYYSAVTPFASGGQPVQAYYMMQDGIPIGYASSILTVKFLVYQVILSFYCVIVMALKFSSLITNYPQIIWLSILGFIINAGAILLIFLVMVNKAFVLKLAFKLIRTGHRLRLIKDLDKSWKALSGHLEDFHKSAGFVRKNLKEVAIAGFMTFLQLLFYFSITYFIYRAFDLSEKTVLDTISMQAVLYMTVSFFPTPGTSGASEGGFYIFFSMFFPKELLFVSMLIWRAVSYYSNILVGGAVILLDSLLRFYQK
ncbi:MAG: lysylphosphatidylglycerol synthase transmembrane domain-containing protein [Clostridia bacterium]|jgi:uncharacterized protein (TIRG00374 family)